MDSREAFERNKRPREPKKRTKFCYVGVPAIFKLELACQQITEAFCGGQFGHIYMVGSATERPDFRDVDLVCILHDADFNKLFPDVADIERGIWEHDTRWLLLTIMISDWLSSLIGMTVDFKFQAMSFANKYHAKHRQPMGLRYAKPTKPTQ